MIHRPPPGVRRTPLARTAWLLCLALLCFAGTGLADAPASAAPQNGARLAYLVSDQRIPFWDIMARGIRQRAGELGYRMDVYSAENDAKRELQNLVRAIKDKVDGLIISPTNSSACATLLKLAERAGIPVVIADIGTDSGKYLSYISSNNREGAYLIGQVLARRLHALGWQNGRVGIISIPQKRENGKARTAGFMQAMEEAGIKGGDLRQQVNFSYRETYDFSRELIDAHPDLRALWLQGSDRYQGALDAIRDAGRQGQILLICFDAEPEFLDLIPQGTLVGAAMQQPFLMGEMAVNTMDAHRRGQAVEKEQQLPILAISAENIAEKLPVIRRNVLGISD
jgi:ribose transport system substrate-binding protein